MKQIFQHLSDGRVEIVECPAPRPANGELLLRSTVSLISAGTERMLLDFGRANLVDKVRQQPGRVAEVLAKARADGVIPTIEAVRTKLNLPIPLGYSNVGVVEGVGQSVSGFRAGDRVVSNGPHAEVVCVGRNLCAHVPDGVSSEAAAFTIVGSIGLQGIRLAQPVLGEKVVVFGAGLIGLMTIQLLVAQGCEVLAVDLDDDKLRLAAGFGAEICNPVAGDDPIQQGLTFSRGRGVDAVLIAAATKSNNPISQAAQMCRKRGRIVLVGVAGLELNRADFYEKELSFQVSCSYGPGRYDRSYEQGGHDYPFGFVRWTEQRNFEAVLALLARGTLDVQPLISREVVFDDAASAYDLLTEDRHVLGILLRYSTRELGCEAERTVSLRTATPAPGDAIVSFIGAGNYASRVLIPAFSKAGSALHTLVTSGGARSAIHGKQFGFSYASTDVPTAIEDVTYNVLVVATRHGSHAELVRKAIHAGKHVFVEKPLALTLDELDDIQQAWNAPAAGSHGHLMVGFNRRFAPHVVQMKQLLASVNERIAIVITVNAGPIPLGHWVHDPIDGGGRVVGEACHFIDLARFLVGAPIANSSVNAMQSETHDTVTLSLRFDDGSTATIHYFSNGNRAFPKERIEVFCSKRVLQLDNFRVLRAWGWSGFSRMRSWRQDKGVTNCVSEFLKSIRLGVQCPIPIDEIFEVSRVSIELQDAID